MSQEKIFFGGRLSPVPKGGDDTLATMAAKINRMFGELYAGNVTDAQVSLSAPASENVAAVQGAIDTLHASGGGLVTMRGFSAPIQISAGITPRSGVRFIGVGAQIDPVTQRALSGSVLQGDGTFDVFSYNGTAGSGDYASSGDMFNDALWNMGIEDIGIDTCRTGVRLGAAYKASMFYSRVKNVHVTNFALDWGIWIENFGDCELQYLRATKGQATIEGGIHIGASVGSVWNFGNSVIGPIFVEHGVTRKRSLRIQARNGSDLNNIRLNRPQANSHGAIVSQAATMTNGQPGITVTDASLFPVDMPVVIDGQEADVYGNGFVPHRTVFVIASNPATDGIMVSAKLRGVAIAATGNAAVNVKTYGFPAIEISGIEGSFIESISASSMDAEGLGTANVVVQDTHFDLQLDASDYNQGGNVESSVVVRSSFGDLKKAAPIILDFDNTSVVRFNGQLANDAGSVAVVNAAPVGFLYDRLAQLAGVSFGGASHGAKNLHLAGINAIGESYTYPVRHMGQRAQNSPTQVLTLYGIHMGSMVYRGAGAATWTLNAITGLVGGVPNSEIGTLYEVTNRPSTADSMTLNCAGTDTFNGKPGATSLTLARYETVVVRAQSDGTTAFWQVLSRYLQP